MTMSMTGYGRAERSEDGKTACVEVKSVNHRFLEVNVKSTGKLFAVEDCVRKTVKKRFERGYFDINVVLTVDEKDEPEVVIQEPLLKGYMKAAREMSENYGLSYPPAFGELIQIKDLFCVKNGEVIPGDWNGLVGSALCDSLEQVETTRKNEGALTESETLERLDGIEKTIGIISNEHDSVADVRCEKLIERIKKLAGDIELDDARIAQEAAILVDKADISEELMRMRSHLVQVKNLFGSGAPVGRKLEFFIQEINRETNTIGSKTISPEATNMVVQIKSELEKLREQAQNLE